MSPRKRPLAEIAQPQQTPSRYAPSTPHAIRALQQRSGAKQRSARTAKRLNDVSVRPDSARGILRQFAKLTAPVTKKTVATPAGVDDKENRDIDDDEDDDAYRRSALINPPHLSFAIESSIEEEDSELPTVPTPSVLPDDDVSEDEDVALTFEAIDFARLARSASEKIESRRSMISAADGGEDSDDDPTILTERGRRALSEEATGRMSRYSFGSIRMDDFRADGKGGREYDLRSQIHTRQDDDSVEGSERDEELEFGGETENLGRLQASPSQVLAEESFYHLDAPDEDTFQLSIPNEAAEDALTSKNTGLGNGQDEILQIEDADIDEASENDTAAGPSVANHSIQQSPSRRNRTPIEASAVAQTSRRKRVKLTRHGTTIPCLPISLIKRIAIDSQTQLGKRRPRLGRDHVQALEQATEWFFEQVGEDLAAFSSHAGRKKRIDNDDALMLIKRQRILLGNRDLKDFAKDWLSRDAVKELDLPDEL